MRHMALPWGSTPGSPASEGKARPRPWLPPGKRRAGGTAPYTSCYKAASRDKPEEDTVAMTWCHYEPLDPLGPDLC